MKSSVNGLEAGDVAVLRDVNGLEAGDVAVVSNVNCLKAGDVAVLRNVNGLEAGDVTVVSNVNCLEAGNVTVLRNVNGLEAGNVTVNGCIRHNNGTIFIRKLEGIVSRRAQADIVCIEREGFCAEYFRHTNGYIPTQGIGKYYPELFQYFMKIRFKASG